MKDTGTSISGKSKAIAFLSALIIVLGFILAVVGWMYFNQVEDSKKIQVELNAEKDSIAENLKTVVIEYQELETDNLALNAKLAEEKLRAEKLYKELKKVKQVSFAEIKEYQKELGTLRSILRHMVVEIDSLNTLNQQLIAENIKVKQEVTMGKRTIENLEQRTEELSTTVAKGSVIRARDVIITPLNKRGNDVTRASRVVKIKVCFTLSENNIAKPGIRDAFVRIIGPDGFLLAKSTSDLFDYEGEKIVFSAKREIDYQNQDIELCVFYDNNGELVKGKYQVTVYVDGYMVGTGEFLLK
jgi:K+/H+ antiporter YhaU regulatory subunit KhtT